MTNTKSTKRALLSSILALLLCFAMLLSTTFAWFTDSVSANNNIITSGNLDVELEYSTDGVNWKEVNSETNVFKKGALWEPGHTEVVYLRVSNLGSLSLKYQLGVNIASETEGVNVYGNPFKLSDYIQFGVVDPGKEAAAEDKVEAQAITFESYADARKAVANDAKIISKGYSKSNYLLAGDPADYVALVVYMPETVGNEANSKTGTIAPVINLGINLFATQYTYEVDGSDNNQYDKGAPWTGLVDTDWYNADDKEFTLDTAEELAGLAELVNEGNDFAGKTIKLGADIDLNNVNWTPIGVSGATFNGKFIANEVDENGEYKTEYTISKLRVTGSKGVGLFGYVGNAAHLEGVIIDGAYVSGNDYVGAVMGSGYLSSECLKYCTVTNATVIATPYKIVDDKYDYDGGAKAGVVAGYVNNGHIIGNTAKDSTVMAYRDLGGIAGMGSGENYTMNVDGNTVDNVKLSYITVIGAYADNTPNQNIGDIVGRINNIKFGENSGEAEKVTVLSFTVSNDAELTALMNQINTNKIYWAKEIVINLLANTYSGNYTIKQYPNAKGNNTNYANEYTNLTFIGEEGVEFTGNVTVTGSNYSGGGFSKHTAKTTFNGVTFDAANSADNEEDKVVMYVTTAADDVNFVGCTFENATHIIMGNSGSANGVGEVNFDTCVFNDGGCLSGYMETLNVTNSTVNSATNGFINKSKSGTVTVDKCNVKCSVYFLRTDNKDITATVTNSTIVETDVSNSKGTGLVVFRGSEHIATFTNCDLTYQTAKDGAGTGLLIIEGEDLDGNWAVTDVASLKNAMSKGGNVKLYNDVALTDTLEIATNATISLDLNGKTIKGTGTEQMIVNNGTVTVKGGTVKNTVTNGKAVINNNGTMVLDDVAIVGAPVSGTEDYPEYAVITTGKLTVEDGTSITADCGAIAMKDGADVTINGGDIKVTDALGTHVMTTHVIDAKGYNSKLTIYDGNFALNYASGAGVSVISPRGATIEIYGGNFTYAGEKGGQNGIFQNYMGYGDTVDVYGGTYNDTTFNGGFYQVSHLADGYKAVENANGTWTVGVATAAGLTTAIANGGTVTLTDDITLEFDANDNLNNGFTVAAGTKAVIDLGGKNLTVKKTDDTSAFLIVEGDLTITGEGNVAVRQINTREGSKLTLGEGVTIETSNSFAINNSGTTEINGATINHTGTNHAIQNQGGTLIINDATVTSTSTSNINTINSQGGKVIINGGTFTHDGSMGSVIKWLYSNEGEIIINGGTFIQKGGDSLASIDYGDAKLTINGGTFDSASYFAQPMQNIVINAGEFKNNATTVFNPFMHWTIADKYIPATSTATTNADGSITVTVNN